MPAEVLAYKLRAVAEPAIECRVFKKSHDRIGEVFRIFGY
jgi:hypothetical protein